MWTRIPSTSIALLLTMFAIAVCSPSGDEPERVTLPVIADAGGIEKCINDLGWEVGLEFFSLAIRDLEFTVEGETHANRLYRFQGLLLPSAVAHPGHYAGGDVTGELSGDFVLNVLGDEQYLGDAELLVGKYNGVNLKFRRATAADGLEDDDPLFGHTAIVSGLASRDEQSVEFTVTVDVDENMQMVGGPFELEADKDTSTTLALQVLTIDPNENDTLFDGIDFGELDDDDDGAVQIDPGQAAHNIFRKTLVRHDHYRIAVRR